MKKFWNLIGMFGLIVTIVLSFVCLYFISEDNYRNELGFALIISSLLTHFALMNDYRCLGERIRNSKRRALSFSFTLYTLLVFFRLSDWSTTFRVSLAILSAVIFFCILVFEQFMQWMKEEQKRMGEEITSRRSTESLS